MKRIRIIAICLSVFLVAVLLSACSGESETIYKTATELSYYDGSYVKELDDERNTFYNEELWRRGDNSISGADPLVLDDTARSGLYYAYVTGFTYYTSPDLIAWTSGGSFVDLSGELSSPTTKWAPEVIYDENTELYYAFFTITPQADSDMEGAPAVIYLPVVAVSETAAGPFVPVDLTDPEDVEAVLGEGYEQFVRTATEDYPQYYAKYALLDNAQYQAAFDAQGLSTGERIITISGNTIGNCNNC